MTADNGTSVKPLETEADFLGWVRDLAHLRRWRTYHTLRSKGSESGFPDLVMVRGGRLVFAELKTASGRLTGDQSDWLHTLELVPLVEIYLWRPRDREAIMRILE
jgi:VRR-NUC domain-containing protein